MKTKKQPVFQQYAQYYDLFYQKKNYKAECVFIEKIMKRFSRKKISTMIDWGCGTGTHALQLESRGYAMTGIDRSSEMILQAKTKCKKAHRNTTFIQSSVEEPVYLDPLDAAISMFAVVGYQTSNAGLIRMMQNVRRNMTPGGIFLFDCWYGPGVLLDPPQDRIAEFASGRKTILRLAHPTIHWDAQVVDVEYRIIVKRGNRIEKEMVENHAMRFFFLKEIEFLLELTGFRLLHYGPTYELDTKVSSKTWNIYLVAEAIKK
jgi:SAM-dependent methyltransferase